MARLGGLGVSQRRPVGQMPALRESLGGSHVQPATGTANPWGRCQAEQRNLSGCRFVNAAAQPAQRRDGSEHAPGVRCEPEGWGSPPSAMIRSGASATRDRCQPRALNVVSALLYF